VFAPGPALSLERGWVAPVYGRKLEAPVVSAVVGGVEASFVTLVAPLDPGEPPPGLTVRREGGRTAVEVDGWAVAWRVQDGELALEEGRGW
jgi:hypothetical protein